MSSSTRPSPRVRVVLVSVFVALFTLGCPSRGHGDDDARAIARAFEDFENAQPSDRTAALEALKNQPCRDPADCADRDVCVRYATSMQQATVLASKAKSLGPEDAGGNGAATPQELATIVAAADDALKNAEATRQTCLQALDRLHRRAKAE